MLAWIPSWPPELPPKSAAPNVVVKSPVKTMTGDWLLQIAWLLQN